MYYSHLVTLQQLAETYQHEQPLSLFLKSFFRVNKKYGSRDRKNITRHIFNYYRLGRALPDVDFYTRLQAASYLVDNIIIDEKLNVEKPFINSPVLDKRLASVKNQFPEFTLESVFPFGDELSKEVDNISFAKSILTRPKVFIRIRNGFEEKVKEELLQARYEFEIIHANTFSFEQETKITETKSFEKGWFEIQDLSSQQTGTFFEAKPGEHWWDCCAGAGGKSLMFKDKFPETSLLISDARESILVNAGERLKRAGVKKYEIGYFEIGKYRNPEIWEKKEVHTERTLADGRQGRGVQTRNPKSEILNLKLQNSSQYDGIIVDAPCSGSGTWSRTPENISFFKKEMILEFQVKQISIVEYVIQFLKPHGQLIYITCSAFKKENEEVTKLLLKSGKLELIREQVFSGYTEASDTMYAAHFVKRE